MKPSLSILSIAIAQLIGFGVILLGYASFLWGVHVSYERYPANHQVLPTSVWVAFIIVPVFCSLLGIATALGLLFLHEWARKTAIFLAVVPLMGEGILAILRPEVLFPPGQITGIVFVVFQCVIAITALISFWWLIALTRPRIKEQFRRSDG